MYNTDVPVVWMVVSCANTIVDASVHVGHERGWSFTWITNKLGPNMEPWGTPARVVSGSDLMLLMIMNWEWSDK